MGVPGIDRNRLAVLALGLTLLLAGCASAVRWENTADGLQGRTYTVRQGDTLYSIAFRHQLDYRTLARWNGIGNSYLIKPGQTLKLYPGGGGSQETTRTASRSSSPPPRSSAPARTPPPARPAPQRPASPPARPTMAKGQWIWPARGDILQSYSERSKGINIGGQVGDSIRASAEGTVVYAGSALKGYGLLVIVKHSEAELSAYGHNRKLLVKEGQRVKQGEVLAEMGLGPSRQPLLHFEIRHNGQPVNPLGLLPSG